MKTEISIEAKEACELEIAEAQHRNHPLVASCTPRQEKGHYTQLAINAAVAKVLREASKKICDMEPTWRTQAKIKAAIESLIPK